jgi:hypothetical protein
VFALRGPALVGESMEMAEVVESNEDEVEERGSGGGIGLVGLGDETETPDRSLAGGFGTSTPGWCCLSCVTAYMSEKDLHKNGTYKPRLIES